MRWFGLTLALLALIIVNTSAFPRTRRQAELQEPENLSPLDESPSVVPEEDRNKRALEAITQVKWGAKNAVLGFVFGNPREPRSVSTTDNQPSLSRPSYTSPKRPSRGGPSSFSSSNSLYNIRPSPRPRPTTTTEDIPVFDRNRVTLDFPGNLFGPSVSLLIKSTKIVGSVIQNSAERYQSFLRLFRPFFRGAFEIKGLDPITTTTIRTTTAKKSSKTLSSTATLSNEIRR